MDQLKLIAGGDSRFRDLAMSECWPLKQGLFLTLPQLPPERGKKGHIDWRSSLLSDYTHFLSDHKRRSEAVALLREELANAPALSESSVRAAHVLAFDFSERIDADDAVLWNWLRERPAWGHTEERLLWRMLETAPGHRIDAYFNRAEKLAAGADPSRACVLGWIMNRMHFVQRSLPLLKRAVETTTDKELRLNAIFTLLESYLDMGNWKEAESIFPEAAQRLTTLEIPQWYSRLAVAAAKEGARTDALRLWSRTANVAPTAMNGLEELAKLGLRDDLIAFYQALRKDMPDSLAPSRALKFLAMENR